MSDKVVREMKVAARHKELCKKNRIKPVKVLEKEKREEGLNTTLDAGNKGFAMLQKMGFKPGMSLGKQGISLRQWNTFMSCFIRIWLYYKH